MKNIFRYQLMSSIQLDENIFEIKFITLLCNKEIDFIHSTPQYSHSAPNTQSNATIQGMQVSSLYVS